MCVCVYVGMCVCGGGGRERGGGERGGRRRVGGGGEKKKGRYICDTCDMDQPLYPTIKKECMQLSKSEDI